MDVGRVVGQRIDWHRRRRRIGLKQFGFEARDLATHALHVRVIGGILFTGGRELGARVLETDREFRAIVFVLDLGAQCFEFPALGDHVGMGRTVACRELRELGFHDFQAISRAQNALAGGRVQHRVRLLLGELRLQIDALLLQRGDLVVDLADIALHAILHFEIDVLQFR